MASTSTVLAREDAPVTSDHAPGVLLIVGSVVFGVGAAIGVPQIFTEADPQARLRLLTEHLGMWRAAQPLCGLGPVIAAAGVGYLAAIAPTRGTRATFAAACLTMAVGALAWAWSLYLRGIRVSEFALGRLPGWPFATYVLLTIGGLALLGTGLLAGRFPVWLGWLTLSADLIFLAGYLWFKDLPPFVFYLLLLLVGLGVI
jgi:hypothetical protein